MDRGPHPHVGALTGPVDRIVLGREFAEDLLDELHLFVDPTAIGTGLPVFGDTAARRRFRLVEARAFDCGITALHCGRP